jgi:hypothetical protein
MLLGNPSDYDELLGVLYTFSIATILSEQSLWDKGSSFDGKQTL